MALELRHIRYFLAVAEDRNFTRAARRVGIAQPALSQQIRDLEAEVGAQLFHRVPQGAELTEAGAAFLKGVQTLPEQTIDAVHAARRAARGETGAIRVGFTGSAAFNPIVPSVIRSYRRLYPDVQLSLREGNSLELAALLLGGRIDAAFLRPDAGELGDLHHFMLAEERLIAALPSAHPAAAGEFLELKALSGEAFILTPRDEGPTLFDAAVNACRTAGFEPSLGQSAPQIASVLAFVAAELGVSLVPSSMRNAMIQGVSYRDLGDGGATVHIALAHRRGEQSQAVQRFSNEARRNIG
jgi:DNA-binding transcriptional LysR family regulator